MTNYLIGDHGCINQWCDVTFFGTQTQNDQRWLGIKCERMEGRPWLADVDRGRWKMSRIRRHCPATSTRQWDVTDWWQLQEDSRVGLQVDRIVLILMIVLLNTETVTKMAELDDAEVGGQLDRFAWGQIFPFWVECVTNDEGRSWEGGSTSSCNNVEQPLLPPHTGVTNGRT